MENHTNSNTNTNTRTNTKTNTKTNAKLNSIKKYTYKDEYECRQIHVLCRSGMCCGGRGGGARVKLVTRERHNDDPVILRDEQSQVLLNAALLSDHSSNYTLLMCLADEVANVLDL